MSTRLEAESCRIETIARGNRKLMASKSVGHEIQAVSQKLSLNGFARRSRAGFAFQKWYTIFEKHQGAIRKKWTGSSRENVFDQEARELSVILKLPTGAVI